MKCKACLRTTAPSQTKTFSGFDFCKRCYDALSLNDLEKKELQGYLKSLSTEDNTRLYEALVTIASKFRKKERELILLLCVQAMGDEATMPEDVLAFLLAALALQESSGTEPLSKVGELALLNISARLTSELIDREDELTDELSDQELLTLGGELLKKEYSLCMDVFNQLEPSTFTETIKEELGKRQDAFESMFTTVDVNLSTVKEGIYLECSEDTIDILLDELAPEEELEEELEEEPEEELEEETIEHVFQGWKELADTLKEMEDDFIYDGIRLTIAEEEYYSPIYTFVYDSMIYITTEWESIKEMILSEDIKTFIAAQKEIPPFVMEKAAGGIEPFQKFLEKVMAQHEDEDLLFLYVHLLTEQEKTEEAVQFVEKKVSDAPDNTALLMELAVLKSAVDQPEEAIEIYQKLTELEPENWFIPAVMGNTYSTMGAFKKAKESYEKALALIPQSPFLMNALIEAEAAAAISIIEELISQEDYEEALKIIDEYFDPFEIDAFHYYKGVILSRMRNPKEALTLMADYVDLFPEDEEGWMEKAGIYLDLHQFAAAARCFRRCSLLNPQDIHPIIMEAFCHKQLGKSRSYKRCINQAKKIDPEGTKALIKEFRI